MGFREGYMIKRKLFFVLLTVAIIVTAGFAVISYQKKGCSVASWLNPDMSCRIRDESGDRIVVEYFNRDTNELLLYIQNNGVDLPIEHPDGRVSNYYDNIAANEIKLDRSDSRYLIVNGERFEITPKK